MIRRSSSRRVQEAIGSSKKRFSRYRAPDAKATKQQQQPEEMPSINNNGSVAGDYNNECQSVYSAFCPTENENMSIYAYSLGGSSINGDKSLVLDLDDDDDDDDRSFRMPAPVKKRYDACDTAPKLPGTDSCTIPMNINISNGSQQFHDSVRSMWTSGYDEEDPAVDEPFEEPIKPQSYHTETDDSSFCESSNHTPQSPAAVSFRAPPTRTSASASTGRPRPSLADCYAQAQSTPAIMVGGGSGDNDEPPSPTKKEKKSHKRSSFWTSMRFGGGGTKKNDKKDKMKDSSNHKIKEGSGHSKDKDSGSSSMFLSFRKATRTKTVKVSLKKTTQKKSHRPQQQEEEEYRSERRASF